MTSLLGITDDMEALDQLLAEMGGDITDEQVAEYIDRLFTENGDRLNQKVDNYAALIREQEARAAIRREESERLARLATRDENAARFLKDRLKFVMERLGMPRIETGRHVVAVVKNGGKQRLTLPDDLQQLPEAYRELVPQDPKLVIRTDDIRAAIERGEPVPGCTLQPRGTRLSLR